MTDGMVTTTPKTLSILGFSVSSGALIGALAHSVALPFYSGGGVLFEALMAVVFGAVVGLVCSPIVAGLLWHRDLEPSRPIVLWSTSLVTVALALVLGQHQLFLLMAMAGGIFVLASLAARWALPRIWVAQGLCRWCGYDIRASLEFDRCPECGRSFSQAGWLGETRSQTSPRGCTARLLVTRPWLPVVVVILILLAPTFIRERRRAASESAICQAIEASAQTGHVFDLGAATTFEWDTVYVFPPYSSPQEVEQALGFTWTGLHRTHQLTRYIPNFVVFVRDRTVVDFVKLTGHCEFARPLCAKAIPRDAASFEVEEIEPGRFRISRPHARH